MNKTEKTKKCQEILHKYKIGERVMDEDTNFLISIFENHNEWEKKKGVGIAFISVDKIDYYNPNNRCFFLNRIDNSKTDISFHFAIKNSTPLDDIKRACRSAVSPDIAFFKEKNIQYGITRCEITNDILTKENTHIDHYDLTFEELFKKWIENKNIKDLKTNDTNDMEFITYFKDNKNIEDFRLFHNKNTHLRGITKYANTSILRRKNKEIL